MRIFVDSDVVISSLISSSGAAYFLLHNVNIKPVVSNLSLKELRIVVKRLSLDKVKFEKLVKEHLEVVGLQLSDLEVKKEYADYVVDSFDAHIVAGAVYAKTRFLITYNIKHFKTERMKVDSDILVMKPATFLQYLRNL